MRTTLRVVALIIGIIGFVDGVITNFIVAAYRDVARLIGVQNVPSHGIIGFILCVIGLIGAFLALRQPWLAALLLVIAAIGFFVVARWWALLASPQFILAAVIAVMDRAEAPRLSIGGAARRDRLGPPAPTA